MIGLVHLGSCLAVFHSQLNHRLNHRLVEVNHSNAIGNFTSGHDKVSELNLRIG